MHSGVCASAKVKRWHNEATFVPCKHDPVSMKLCHAACVCVCVCVRAYVSRGIKLMSASGWGRGQWERLQFVCTSLASIHASTHVLKCQTSLTALLLL